MSTLREVLQARANSGHGVITHTELRTILAAHLDPEAVDAAQVAAAALREAAEDYGPAQLTGFFVGRDATYRWVQPLSPLSLTGVTK